MNVYDFDKTIYDGDSTIDFYIFCLKKFPQIVMCLPAQLVAMFKYKLKIINKTKMKEEFYCFFSHVPDLNFEIKRFWDENGYKIKDWYTKKRKESDVIISASPEILLKEICNRIGVKYLIASNVDETGKYVGANCYGKEKVLRYFEQFPNEIIEEFYSDSYSDEPLAKISKKSFLVSKNSVKKWYS